MGHTDWRWTDKDVELQKALGWWAEIVYRQGDRKDDGRALCFGGPADGATILTSFRYPLAMLVADPNSGTGWAMVRVGASTLTMQANGGVRLPFLVSYGDAMTMTDEGAFQPLGAYVRTYRDDDLELGRAYTEARIEEERRFLSPEPWEANDPLDDDGTLDDGEMDDTPALVLPDPILVWQAAGSEPTIMAPVPATDAVLDFLAWLGGEGVPLLIREPRPPSHA